MHSYLLTALVCLLPVWLIVLCWESGCFHSIVAEIRSMSPLTRAVMAVLCVYCTVIAQKPSKANNTFDSTNALPATASLQDETGGTPPFAGGSATQDGQPQEALGLTQEQTPDAPQRMPVEPSRVVFQSTPATDTRKVVAFGGETGWGTPSTVSVTPELNAVSFDGGWTNVPSPVSFPNANTITVQTLILTARGNSTDLATLVDAPMTARLRIASAGSLEPEMSVVERSLTEQFQPDRWLVVGIDFDAPTNLPSLYFGGSSGRPEWSRNWKGEIAEIVGFNTLPSADLRAGVANYLAIRWGFGGHPATPEQRQAAIDAGLSYGTVWGTVLIIR